MKLSIEECKSLILEKALNEELYLEHKINTITKIRFIISILNILVITTNMAIILTNYTTINLIIAIVGLIIAIFSKWIEKLIINNEIKHSIKNQARIVFCVITEFYENAESAAEQNMIDKIIKDVYDEVSAKVNLIYLK